MQSQLKKLYGHCGNKGFDKNEISIIAKDDKRRTGKQDMEVGGEMGWVKRISRMEQPWGGALGGVAGLLASVGGAGHSRYRPNWLQGPWLEHCLGSNWRRCRGLIDLGIPEERGRQYENELKQGGVLAVVETSDDKVNEASGNPAPKWCQGRGNPRRTGINEHKTNP